MRGSAFHRPQQDTFLCSLCLCASVVPSSHSARTAAAQEEAIVEQLAPLIAAEDARDFKPDLFARGMVAPDSLVRRIAALAAGRIGDLRATPLIVPLLADPDSTVRVSAAFALGVLRDSAAVQPIIDRLTGLPALEPATAVEAVTALAKIGGPAVGGFFAGVLGGKVVLSQDDREPGTREIVAAVVATRARRPGRQSPAVHGRHQCRGALACRLRARPPAGSGRRGADASRPP